MRRTCPALERTRARSEERRRAAAYNARLARRAVELERWTVGGIDFRAEARRLWALPVLREARGISGRPAELPQITLRRRKDRHASGTSYSSGRIVVTVGSDVIDGLGCLLHELVHSALPVTDHHGRRFWSFLQQATVEAWPEVGNVSLVATGGSWTKFDRQEALVEAMRRVLERPARMEA